jgi:hypothetical protein
LSGLLVGEVKRIHARGSSFGCVFLAVTNRKLNGVHEALIHPH